MLASAMAYIVQALRGAPRAARKPPLPLFLLQPPLRRIVRGIANRHPQLIERLGPHRGARFLIDPIDLPFALLLQPNPPSLTAVARRPAPAHEARIAARFGRLMRMIDGDQDGDAMFFARDLQISGDTEAVVSLRNAIDNLDAPLAEIAADLFGPPGRLALALMRRFANRRS